LRLEVSTLPEGTAIELRSVRIITCQSKRTGLAFTTSVQLLVS
jgi:hypothetical protein